MNETRHGYCQCGCGQKTKIATRNTPARYQIKGEPQRRIAGHGRRKFNGPDYQVLENGCWQWLKSLSPEGYGRMSGRVPIHAHRAYYEKTKGPIPKGLDLDHLCRNPACVNPDHLEPVPHQENVRRGKATKLTATQVGEIKRRYNEGEKIKDLASAYGMSYAMIHQIMQGRYWADVPAEVK